MADITVFLAKLMPEEVLLEMLSDALQEYRTVSTDENRKRLLMTLGLASLKFASEKMSMAEVSKEIEQIGKFRQMFKSTN